MPIIRGRGFHSYRDYKNFAVWTRVTIVPCPLTLETPFPSRERAKQTCRPVNRMRALSAPVLVGAARAIHNICCAFRANEANSAILHRPEQRDGGSVRSARCISQLEYRSASAVDHRDCRGNICGPPRIGPTLSMPSGGL